MCLINTCLFSEQLNKDEWIIELTKNRLLLQGWLKRIPSSVKYGLHSSAAFFHFSVF